MVRFVIAGIAFPPPGFASFFADPAQQCFGDDDGRKLPDRAPDRDRELDQPSPFTPRDQDPPRQLTPEDLVYDLQVPDLACQFLMRRLAKTHNTDRRRDRIKQNLSRDQI